MLEILHAYGASLAEVSRNDSQMQPIHWAASDGQNSSLAFLLNHKADINVQDGNGCTPLVVAVQHNQHDTVLYLILLGADATLGDTNRDTCLHWAAYKGFVEMTGLLSFQFPHFVALADVFGQVSETAIGVSYALSMSLIVCMLSIRHRCTWQL